MGKEISMLANNLRNRLHELSACPDALKEIHKTYPEGLVDLQQLWAELKPSWKVWYLARLGWKDPKEVAVWLLRELHESTKAAAYREVASRLERNDPLQVYLHCVLPHSSACMVDGIVQGLQNSSRLRLADCASLLVDLHIASGTWRDSDFSLFPFDKIRLPGEPTCP